MNREITEDILRRSGFECGFQTFFINVSNPIHIYYTNLSVEDKHWRCVVYSDKKFHHLFVDIYIQTVEHFNKLMDIMDVEFRFKEG